MHAEERGAVASHIATAVAVSDNISTDITCSDVVGRFKTDIRKITAFALRGAVIAIGAVGTMKVMSTIGQDEAAAASFVASLLGFVVGSSAGWVGSAGGAIAKARGNNDIENLSDIIKTGWIQTIALGAGAGLLCLSSRFWLALFYKKSVADAAISFVSIYTPAPIAEMLLLYHGQLVFKIEGNAWFGLISTAFYRFGTIGLAYYLGNVCGWGAFGVGLAATITSWGSVMLTMPWLFRQPYYDIPGLFQWSLDNFSGHITSMMRTGAMLGLQRLVEWSNLFVITLILGAWSTHDLLSEESSVVMLTIATYMSQNAALAHMLMLKENQQALELKLRNFAGTFLPVSRLQLAQAFRLVKLNAWVANIASVSLSLVLAIIMFSVKNQIINWYLPSDANDNVVSLASLLFSINLLSIPFDALRGACSGLLQGWHDLLFPVLTSLLIVSIAGIATGYGVAEAKDKSPTPLFVLRIVTLALAAVTNVYRVYTHVAAHQTAVNTTLKQPVSSPSALRSPPTHAAAVFPGSIPQPDDEVTSSLLAGMSHDGS